MRVSGQQGGGEGRGCDTSATIGEGVAVKGDLRVVPALLGTGGFLGTLAAALQHTQAHDTEVTGRTRVSG